MSQSESFRPSLPLSFTFPFFSTSHLALEQRMPTPDATTRQPYASSSISFLLSLCMLTVHLFIPHHRHPRGRRYDTQLRYSGQVTRVYISLPSYYSSRRTSFFNQAVLSPFRFHFYSSACLSVSAIVRWNRFPCDLGKYLALALSQSTHSAPSLYPFISLSCSWTTISPSRRVALIHQENSSRIWPK